MYSCDLLICPRSAECSQVWGEMLNRRNLAEAVKPTPLSLSYSKCGIFARNAWKMRYSSISKTYHWLLWHFRDEAVVVPLQPWRCQRTDGKSSLPAHGTKSVVELGGGWSWQLRWELWSWQLWWWWLWRWCCQLFARCSALPPPPGWPSTAETLQRWSPSCRRAQKPFSVTFTFFQKYAVPFTESSPRRVTRKAVAGCTIVLASDPGDLQRF